jgi:aminopeptidase N
VKERVLISWLAGLILAGCVAGDGDNAPNVLQLTGPDDSVTSGPSVIGNIRQYNYTFDIATGHATAELDIDVFTGGGCFATGFELGSVSAATWNGAPARSAAVANNMITICGNNVARGAPLAISVDVVVPKQTSFLDVGFSTKKDRRGGDFTYLLSWIGGCDRLGPCDAVPGRLASYQFTVHHAPSDVVLCPGVLTPGATVTQCSLTGGALAPTYSAFGIANDPLWQQNNFLSAGGVDVVFYEIPGGFTAASLNQASVAAFLTWITGLLGPYPYGTQIRYAGAPTAWLGFEHPGNIILNQNLPFGGPYSDSGMHALMHETVHQWAGDRTTLASTMDFGWKEALAEYLAYVFEDEQRPTVEAATSLQYWSAVSLLATHFTRPTDTPSPALSDFYTDVYGEGTMTLFVQLESLLGRQHMLDGIKAFLAQPVVRSIDDLRHSLEMASGVDLQDYFNAWVFGSGQPEWPTFAIATSQVGGNVTVTVSQQNASHKLYGCKVEVMVSGATTSAIAVVDFGVAPQTATATATVTLPEPVVRTVFEPRHRVVGHVAGAPPAQTASVKVWPL